MVKHGSLMETSEAPRILSWACDKTFKRWKLSHQTPQSIMLSAPFTAVRGSKVDGSWSGFADNLFITDELPDHTAESAKDIILSNAADDSHRWFPLERSLAGPGTSEAATISTGATKRKPSAGCKRWRATWSALRGFWFARSPWSHRRLIFLSRIVSASITGLDAYAASLGGRSLRAEHTTVARLRVTGAFGPTLSSFTSGKVLPARA